MRKQHSMKVVVLLAVLLAGTAHADTLCPRTEVSAFSCAIGSKILSVCSKPGASGPQYRFGQVGHAPDLAFPVDWPREQPLLVERSTRFENGGHFYEYTLDFENSGFDYQVSVEEPGSPEKSGVSVMDNRARSVTFNCRSGTERLNMEELERLAITNGRTPL